MSPQPVWMSSLNIRWASNSLSGSFPWGKENASESVLSYGNAPYEIPTLTEALISECLEFIIKRKKNTRFFFVVAIVTCESVSSDSSHKHSVLK